MGSYPWASAFWTDARQTVAPPRDAQDGLLPPLLVALTAVTGRLGRSLTGSPGRSPAGRRLISVAAMFGGALAGALLVLRVHIVYPLVIALIILAAVAVLAVTWARKPQPSPYPAP